MWIVAVNDLDYLTDTVKRRILPLCQSRGSGPTPDLAVCYACTEAGCRCRPIQLVRAPAWVGCDLSERMYAIRVVSPSARCSAP